MEHQVRDVENFLASGEWNLNKKTAALIGEPWPPQKGWRTRVKIRLGLLEMKPSPPPKQVLVDDPDGKYWVRAAMTGRAHQWENGAPLCRISTRPGKYVRVREVPSGIPICSNCQDLLLRDPLNVR